VNFFGTRAQWYYVLNQNNSVIMITHEYNASLVVLYVCSTVTYSPSRRYLTLSEADRVKLRTGLMRYLDQVLLKQSAAPTLQPIRNKYAQVLVLVFKHEYPGAWPQFFSELWSALGLAPGTTQNPTGVPLWLLVLQTIDQEVVARDVPRSTAELAHNAAIVSITCSEISVANSIPSPNIERQHA